MTPKSSGGYIKLDNTIDLVVENTTSPQVSLARALSNSNNDLENQKAGVAVVSQGPRGAPA